MRLYGRLSFLRQPKKMVGELNVQGFFLRSAPSRIGRSGSRLLLTKHWIPGFYEANSASLCQLIFQTLFEYIDLSSQRAVLDFIRQAVSNEFFLKTFAGAICRVDPSSYGRKVRMPDNVLIDAMACMHDCMLFCCNAAVFSSTAHG